MSDNKDRIQHLRKNISSLEGEMRGLNEQLDLNPEDLLPNIDMLDGIQDIQIFDYEEEIAIIKEDCVETLECLSKLYLSADDIESKNLSNIIKNDAEALSDLKFTISCSKRGLISLMKNLDLGISDPEMYKAIGAIQKEIRDSIKLLIEIQKKMKTFYKEIRDELSEIITVVVEDSDDKYEEAIIDDDESTLHIIDMDKLTEELTAIRNKKDN